MEQNEFYQLIGCWKENCLGFLLMCCIFNENRYCGRYATCILWTFILNSMYCKLSFRIFSDAQEFKERLVMRLPIWRSQSRLPVTVCHQERAFWRFCTTQELQSKSTKVRPWDRGRRGNYRRQSWWKCYQGHCKGCLIVVIAVQSERQQQSSSRGTHFQQRARAFVVSFRGGTLISWRSRTPGSLQQCCLWSQVSQSNSWLLLLCNQITVSTTSNTGNLFTRLCELLTLCNLRKRLPCTGDTFPSQSSLS